MLFLLVFSLSTSHADTVTVLGSSTAAGTGASTYDSCWVANYSRYLGTNKPGRGLVNLAVGGYTSFHILPTGSPSVANRPAPDTAHNITRALKTHPVALIINMPTNDIANGYLSAEYMKNLDTVVAIAKRNKVPVWLSTTQPRDFTGTDAPKRDTLKALSILMKTHYAPHCIDFWTSTADTSNNILTQYGAGDGIHLNNAGHRVLFNLVVAAHIPDTIAIQTQTIHPQPQALTVVSPLSTNKSRMVDALGRKATVVEREGASPARAVLTGPNSSSSKQGSIGIIVR